MPYYMEIRGGWLAGLGTSSVPIGQLTPGWEEITPEMHAELSAKRYGGTFDLNGVYQEPPAPAPSLTNQQFLMLLTRPQFHKLRQLRDEDDDISYYFALMDSGSSIDLGHPMVQGAIALLQTKDPILFTAAEIARILSGSRPA